MELAVQLHGEFDEDVACDLEVFSAANIDRQLEFEGLLGWISASILTGLKLLV